MEHQELAGTVERIIYHNEENGFAVFVLQIQQNHSSTVCGFLHAIQPGEHVQLQGSWIMHPKFGKQFQATSCTATTPTSVVGLKKYLGSGLIKGIGPVYAEKLVNYFGADVLTIIDKHPQRLHEVDGIGQKRIEMISAAWQQQKEVSTIMVFLQDKGISPAYAIKIYKKYGQESITVINENPYRLAEDIWGVGFKTADQIAQRMGFEKNSLKRIKAGILYAITSILNEGHLYSELQKLKDTVIELLEIDGQENAQTITNALHDLYNSQKIALISLQEAHYITLKQYYFSEKGIAQKIQKLKEYPTHFSFNIQEIYTNLCLNTYSKKIQLNEEQQKGILNCLQNKITIITGGPGTGKTTLIKTLLTILDEYKLMYRLAAPTGRAAKRITESTGRHAQTLHRLLEFDFASMTFSKNESDALKLDFLIVDESSMLDVFLAYATLKAMPLTGHLIFIGDVDQLPSVGPGNILNDMISSHQVATTKLQQIFRQAQDSLIIVNAHKINKGEFPVSFLENAKRDFIFIKEEMPEKIAEHLHTLYTMTLPKYHIKPSNSMVLPPMNRGIAGTQKINHDLQTILNPSTDIDHIQHAGTTYKIGDRVMQLRNNYDKHVFNGDLGVIEKINTEDRVITVNFDDRSLEYEASEIDELTLAYAISIHKSQGSEFDAAIIPIFMQHFMLLKRNLIYTAITRAKKLCIFIGQPKAIAMAVKNNKNLKRITFLQNYLTSDLQCR